MSTYVISDIHGNYDGYMKMLDQIRFSNKDILYVNGDVVDRGKHGIKILQHMMMHTNIYPILGNHDYMAYHCLKFLMQEISEENVDTLTSDRIQGILEWQSVGGSETRNEFKMLSIEEKQDIIDYFEEFSLYETASINGNDFVIVHAGLENFKKDKPLDAYQLHELIFTAPNYDKVYYEDKYLVTGHLPTRRIADNPNPDRIYRKNHHIAIDCGSGWGGALGCVCLDTLETFYIDIEKNI